MKFLKGQKVRDVAKRLAMSEANLYRKQKIAIEVVAKTILEMEKQAGKTSKILLKTPEKCYNHLCLPYF